MSGLGDVENARIELCLQEGRITEYQAEIVRAYLQTEDLHATARETGTSYSSTASTLSRLKSIGVLVKETRRSPYKLREGSEQTVVTEKNEINRLSVQSNIHITDFERNWMLEHYPKLKHKRGAAAAALGCDRWRVCQLAIALKLDQKNVSSG
ncbi:hypothetical protein [Paenibacillus graminis]|uniref:hypothetical protein n=1 Tax=Paenibacillus graminis TaxID=189425 RepID=UPI002DBB8810|nr:hypothetical protein [Paenibacillus graminis]MEC0169886.1 hypothetical protein [Paenibacillus graminis]